MDVEFSQRINYLPKKKFENIKIETPNTKYNLIFKKHLNRTFNYKPSNVTKFILKSKNILYDQVTHYH